MSIFARVSDIFKANVNEMLDRWKILKRWSSR